MQSLYFIKQRLYLYFSLCFPIIIITHIIYFLHNHDIYRQQKTKTFFVFSAIYITFA